MMREYETYSRNGARQRVSPETCVCTPFDVTRDSAQGASVYAMIFDVATGALPPRCALPRSIFGQKMQGGLC
ncbi:hypothetical protein ROLI_040900 [Roseobacter fucihabitans]|uniref:Uncharacterized protein n=1 Tax=Roseobacter fucihabitans TaxID=1537242 RepID=A0ABZ2BYB6_9RHOB|nr:hypothetical protein [Roseobacter litoralis]MBC6965867.1 hypothetical protein [Roseobacter litoralis]